MRAIRRSPWLILLLALGVAGLAADVARADALDAAKAAGQLGERHDGYLGVVKGDAPASVKALAETINGKRKAHYGRIAAKESTDPATVAAIAGAKLVESAPSGQYVQPSAGSGWKQVP